MPKIAAVLLAAMLLSGCHRQLHSDFVPPAIRRSPTVKLRGPFHFIDCVIVRKDLRTLSCACDHYVTKLNAKTGGTDITCLNDASWDQSRHRCGTAEKGFAADSGAGCAEELGASFVPGWESGEGTPWNTGGTQLGVFSDGREERGDADSLLPDPAD